MLFGAARGFSGPAAQSLLPFIVPPERLARSIAWSSSAFQTAVIAGPALGGFLCTLRARRPPLPRAPSVFCYRASERASSAVGGGRPSRSRTSSTERVIEGIRFVRQRPVVLGAISLDLFAVLLGGATALLPVYARDILHVGPIGLGVCAARRRSARRLSRLSLGRRPLETSTGAKMFGAVAIFGVSTIVFGISTNFYVSLAALFVLGASDMVSVFIRSALIQFATPDADARPRERGQHAVHRRLQRAWASSNPD